MTPHTIFLHLRVPFSFFLLPVFWFALSQSPAPNPWRTIAVLLIVHLLLYPASNAYNSYFDKDEGPIGGLATPPPVAKSLYWVSWALDIVALLLGAFAAPPADAMRVVNWVFVVYLLIYGFVTKAYSHDRIRLKRYPVFSWLLISLLQGGITYVLTYASISNLPLSVVVQPRLLFGGLLATLNLMALYPVTQVYQHEEDARRGDQTISRILAVRGTFVCTIGVFSVAAVAFCIYFSGSWLCLLYLLFLLPAIVFFLRWSGQVFRDERRADYRNTMRMMWVSGFCLNGFFGLLAFLTHS